MSEENWIYGYDQKQSLNRRSGRAHNHQEQKRRGTSGVQQSVLIVFFDVKVIIR
jgi:hypothetical protein